MKTMIPNKYDDTVIIICSTPYSKRIPNKCFKIINGIPVLKHILQRIDDLGITTIMAVPNVIDYKNKEKYCQICYPKIHIYYGEPFSPLHRMANAIKKFNHYKYVIRITHDDIIIDDKTIIEMLNYVKENNLSYCCSPSIIEGAGVEIILADTIIKQAEKIKYPVEHISYFVKGEVPATFSPRKSIQRPYRLTLDYPKDGIILEAMLREVGNHATVDMICVYIDKNKGLLRYNQLPEVTIYTCMFNAEKYINECVSSVSIAEKLSRTSIEYLIIDDASTDGSLSKAISQLGLWSFTSAKIIVNEHNIGLASSSNKALSMAKGKYIIRVDADDMIRNDAIYKMITKIKEDDAVIVYPDYEELNGEEGKYIINLYQDISGKKYHHAGCALMNKKVINELKFKEGLRHWDSLDLYRRIKSHPELKISYLEEVLFTYRKHENNLSNSEPEKRKKILKEIYKNGYMGNN